VTEEKPKSRKALLIWMIISQVLTVGTLVVWLVMAGLSFMAFDAGVTPQATTFVTVILAYPLFPLALVIAAWIAFARRKDRLAVILSGLSFSLPVLVYIVLGAIAVLISNAK
jgi:hypothetical protein